MHTEEGELRVASLSVSRIAQTIRRPRTTTIIRWLNWIGMRLIVPSGFRLQGDAEKSPSSLYNSCLTDLKRRGEPSFQLSFQPMPQPSLVMLCTPFDASGTFNLTDRVS